MKPTAFALFDFDGTLCRGDSILPYLTFAVGRKAAPVGQLGRALSGYLDSVSYTHLTLPTKA